MRRANGGGNGRFGLTEREAATLARLSPAWRIQKYLDEIDYDVRGEGCRSPRRVLRERKAQCLDGAIFGAAALRMQGHRPLLLDLEAERDDDHVLAVWREKSGWGALARSNFSGLRFREPVFPSLRALVLSYFESYFNLRREKTLRRYSVPFDLSRHDARGWMSAEEDLWWVGQELVGIRHFDLVPPGHERRMGPVDRRLFEAGKVGREEG